MSWETFKSVPWLKVLRVVGCICGACIIALGIYSLVMDSLNVSLVIADIYRIIFGFLILIAELQYVAFLDWFSFLCTLIGLGGFYIFVGGLALGSEWYAIVIAVVLVATGLVYCMAGCACNDDRPTATSLREGGSGSAASSGGAAPAKTQEMKPASWPHMADEAL